MKKIILALLLLSPSSMQYGGDAGSPPPDESDAMAWQIGIAWGAVSITSIYILWLIASRK